ncbi:transglutaminase domain-containing protein [Virgibacillus sp. 179-BFC.A HS]|uniref:Transglutaminase domain-containing protein n=1 Tax=Tigheibacillus jepli TaxID=3035914 RepID=A0ABU5CJQ2_9BACI|nr:transglutaminase domain-containing protein [Virgibacillus sp. 179-BFC.A HS]MDY0406581.1 transglutaminase domain-containing protein [Virgibacillus sp. 179-BFC.A HS]
MAIVRTFVFSFLALGMTSFSRVIQKEQIHFAWKKNAVRWLLPIVLIVSVASLVGYAAPNKAEPKWPDPVPFLQGMAGTGGNGPIQKVGYGEDDSRLGGDFVQDKSPVFQAKIKDQQYWRIESKETYTGKGWESSQKANFRQEIDGIISVRTFSTEVTTNTHDAMVHFVNNVGLPKLAYPYGVSRVSAHEDVAFFSEQQSGSIFTEVDQKEMNLQDYQVYYDEPSYPINEMQKVTSTDDDDVAIDYTQVPKELPERVHELAKEITDPYDNRYDKVKAVEQYFGKHGFTYQTEDVLVPRAGEDYVDQFLFESKRGYCDNYSSSMAVMLRTLGIPTRWVKGFSAGEKIADNPDGDGYDMYEITNSNAHSWVEVYFPNVGWVPFEPTQGFDNPADYEIQAENQENRDTLDVPANSGGAIPKKEEQQPSEKKQQQAQKETPQAEHAKEKTANSWLQPILIVGIAIAVILLAIWIYRKRWWLRTWFIGKSWQKKQDARAFQKTYQHLLKLLSHKGLPLEQGQTLHEFADDVDRRYRTADMRHLTAIYERLIYRNQFRSRDADEITQLWKNLIKQIGA